MSSGFVTPITIKDAIDNIVSRNYLLPAIQRKFVWSSYQIEVLFDSIMRSYPINSFMFWEVKENKVKIVNPNKVKNEKSMSYKDVKKMINKAKTGPE